MSRLLKVTFDCEVITPMFLGGADGRPELRMSGFKSEMRYWLRALLGGILNEDSEKVAAVEQLFFGGTKGEGLQSAILMSLNYNQQEIEDGRKPLLPHKKGNRMAIKQCILPGSLFSLVFRYAKGMHIFRDKRGSEIASVEKEMLFNITLNLIRLVSIVGSVGQRSNRGFGSFSIVNEYSNKFSQINDVSDEIVRLKSALTKSLTELINSIRIYDGYIQELKNNEVSEWPIFHGKVCQVSVGNEVKWDDFITQLMNSIHHDMVQRKLKANVLGGINPRQGSTMKVSMVKTNTGALVPVITNFITKTVGKPTRNDYVNILQFPLKNLNASKITL